MTGCFYAAARAGRVKDDHIRFEIGPAQGGIHLPLNGFHLPHFIGRRIVAGLADRHPIGFDGNDLFCNARQRN